MLAVKLTVAIAGGVVSDPLAIGRPDRSLIGDGTERKTGTNSARDVLYPNVRLGIIQLYRDAIALGRNAGDKQICQFVGYSADQLCIAVRPNQLPIGASSAAKHQQPVLRPRGVHVPGTDVVSNALNDARGRSTQGSGIRIETLRHELIGASEQDKAIGVDRIRFGTEQLPSFTAIERGEIHRIVGRLGRIVVNGQIKEVLAIGKKEGPAV